MTTPNPPAAAEPFIVRWASSGAAERANYQLFLSELCDLLELPRPDPTRADDTQNAYVFERNIQFQEDDGHTSTGRIDLYRRGAFVLEAKQGSDAETAEEADAEALQPEPARRTRRRGTKAWDDAMVRARGQADRYARALPVAEGWPPFLIVVDVGHTIELYSEFSRTGKTYVPFPDPQSFRISLADLRREDVRARLQQVWLDPLSLDPTRRAAKVTRELAQRLAKLAALLEVQKHDAGDVARFLMRALFTMFAEDVELIPRGSFRDLLGGLLDEPQNFKPAAEDLWRTMDTGGFSPILRKHLLRFNGGLFAEHVALPLTREMLELLYEASGADWTDVEPAIFGTLLERALSPVERHKLGAHYTPRAYVERLVLPTVIEPLREDWQAAYAAAMTAARQGDLPAAQKTVRTFHEQLCKTRVLDPACGSGNFLYVTLEQMKRLEGEVLNALREFGDKQQIIFEVDPHQFLGIEVNPRAAAIADLVLWIGYLQWHFRTRGHSAPAEPIIKAYKNIECRDAVLTWDRKELVLDENLKPVTRWDGRTEKVHPVTGEKVPDETARVNVVRYINPGKAEWPEAEFVVGNPPYIGNKRMRPSLGDGYVDALHEAHSQVPAAADFVMFWWHRAADLVGRGRSNAFGFITTNSITQPFNRKVLESHFADHPETRIAFAIPNHPWVDSVDGADVRVSLTVVDHSVELGLLATVCHEQESEDGEHVVELVPRRVRIHSDLGGGANLSATAVLRANRGIAFTGMYPLGQGFVLAPEQIEEATVAAANELTFTHPFFNARDLTQRNRRTRVIDFYPLTEQDAKRKAPYLYQWILNRVKPQRDQDQRESRRRKWWLFAEPVPALRRAITAISRYILVPRTAKYFTFQFQPQDVRPDTSVVAIASDDAAVLGMLSSRIHVAWAVATGGRLGVGNDTRYQHASTFNRFAFPSLNQEQRSNIACLGEQLDGHRKRQQAQHPKLTLTDMYNVLEKLRSGEELTDKDRTIHEQGLVSVLRQLHDDLDAAVFAAYGWPVTLTDEEILERLVALNAERAAEEQTGLIRWLRPEFQNPSGDSQQQKALTLTTDEDDEVSGTALAAGVSPGSSTKPSRGKKTKPTTLPKKPTKRPWPKDREAQAKAVLSALRDSITPVTAAELAQHFTRGHRATIEELLQALTTLGQARRVRGGKFTS